MEKKVGVLQYFCLSKEKNVFVCQVLINGDKLCNSEFSAGKGKSGYAPTRLSNLKRHLERLHPKEFTLMEEKESDKQKQFQPSSSTSSSSTGSLVEAKKSKSILTNYFEAQKINIAMTSAKFKRHIIELVVNSGLPLSVFSSPGFIGLNGEMASKLGVSLDRHNIRKITLEEANNRKNLLKNMLNGKFIHLKMDACTRQRVNYFAINVQFVSDNNETIIRTLAVKDTKAQHASEQVCKLIEDVLKDFEIKKENILTIVTDNASNMIKTVEKLNEKKKDFELEDVDSDLDEEDENLGVDETLDAIASNFTSFPVSNINIQHMRCVVHTLQLAIRDGLKGVHAANLIGKLRKVAIAARSPKIDSILKRRCGKGALIDQVTRWGSVYLMIKRLLDLKPLLIDMANPEITLSGREWEEVDQLERLLRHPYNTTLKFQESYLTPGSFYKEWKSLICKLSQIGGLIANGIKNSMECREIHFLDNNILLAAIYVDPNYRILLSDDQKVRGKKALLNISEKMKGLREKDYEGSLQLDTSVPSPSTSSSEADECAFDFEKHLDRQEKVKKRRIQCSDVDSNIHVNSTIEKFRFDFYQALTLVEKVDRTSKLQVIEAVKKYPLIVQDAAFCVTALPPTQVSVERLFSALKIIKTDLRASMKEDLIEAILFLRANSF